MKYVSKGPEATKEFAEGFMETLKKGEQATVVALYGDLGSGKTLFTQYVGEVLGVHDPIQSPTFLIEKIYELKRQYWEHLIHIDAYRVDNEYELLDLGWREIIKRPENLVLVEWADKIENILPEDAIHIVFTHIDESTRQIEVQPRVEEKTSSA